MSRNSERTLNALMTVKSTLLTYDNKPNLICISKKLLDVGCVAYKSYNAYLLTEANERLKKALRNENLKETALAQAILEGIGEVQEEVEKQRHTVSSTENYVERKKEIKVDI
ncbi:hypothetical protein PR048_020643 [Dryococelus australis]|uniref:Uncharacterized protein n=1 Tax=Dryococelus australis TaxID=614101 RepID=A0ABQ9H6U4_9NEOP|nr:hypothetical protein PR048_020643 [Dryococelus australis]